jgi:hypothetical protein
MKKLFAALAVLTLVLGTFVLVGPVSAQPTYLHGPNQNEGTNG